MLDSPALENPPPAPPSVRANLRRRRRFLLLFLAGFSGMYFGLADRMQSALVPEKASPAEAYFLQQTHQSRALEVRSGLTRSLREWTPHRSDGYSNPLWPWLAARLGPELPLEQGRAFNRALGYSFLVLFTLFLIGRGKAPLSTANLIISLALLFVLPASLRFDPQLLFGLLLLLTWLTAVETLKHNTLGMHLLLGFLAGLSWLAYPLITPLLGTFFLVSNLRFLQAVVKPPSATASPRRAGPWSWQNHLIGSAFLLLAFFLAIGPRLDFAQTTLGSPFAHERGACRWTSHPEQVAAARTEEKVEASGLRHLLTQENPLAIGSRLAAGSWEIFKGWGEASDWEASLRQVPWRGLHLGLLLAALLATAVLVKRHQPSSQLPRQRHAAEMGSILLFTVGAFAWQNALAGWDARLFAELPDLAALTPAVLCSLFAGMDSLLRRFRDRGGDPRQIRFCLFFQVAFSLALAATLVHWLAVLR
ncbi:MAG: hypothetical protein AAF555_07340 [Verrucomicrobiota bacterium]